MTSPMSSYSLTQDAEDFLHDYGRKVKSDPRLEAHQDIIQSFGEDYERAYQLFNTYYAEAYKDLSYYLGNQWSLEELSYLNNQRRSSFTYNKIRRIINLVQGYQRKNRLSSIISPIEDASTATADILTDVLQYIMQYSGGYEIISDAFKGALTTGMAFVSPWIDYRDDPVSGDIKFHLDEWNQVILDPFITKRDLSDCSFLTRRKFLSRTNVISLIPDKQDVIESLPWGSRDDKFTYMPYARQWGMQRLLNYNEYWKQRWDTKEVLVDMQSGETQVWNGDRKRLQMFRQHYPQIQVIKKPVKSVDLGIIVEGQLLYYGKDPGGLSEYPMVPFFAIFEPSYDLYTWKIQSLVRPMRDPQTELNKRRSKFVDIVDNQLNTGWKAKTNSVSNPSSLYKSGQGQVIWMKPESNMTDAERLLPADIPASQIQLSELFEKDFFDTSGVSPESFGLAENDKVEMSGILAKMRQAAAMVNLQDIYDGLRLSQHLLSEKVMKMSQINYTPEKVQLITKKQPTPEFFSKQFSRYNVVVQEGVLTDTQKQTEYMGYAALRQMGVNVPDAFLIKKSNLHDADELEKAMAQQAQQAKQVQQIAQEAQLQQLQSKTEANKALAAERINKVGLDAALNIERLARSEEDRTAGALNLIKAIKELETIDINHLREKLALIKEIEGEQRQDEQKTQNPSPASPAPVTQSAPPENSVV